MGKKNKDIFDKKITYKDLYYAYIQAKKGKTYKAEVIQFSFKYEYFLSKIVTSLCSGTYVFGPYTKFYVYEPKKREILKAKFIDRIVHTWYVKSYLEQIFVPTFIHTSYACIKDRGMHKCALNVKNTLHSLSINDIFSNGYIVKTDVAKFFQNIDRKVLYELIAKKIKDKKFLEFTNKLLESSSIHDKIQGKGLPIGNYTSQIFANIYLNEIDNYIKRTLKCKWYFRYMDDSIVFCKSKLEAKYLLNKIRRYYKSVLKLELNSKTQIFKIAQGVNFCGYKITKFGMRIRQRGKKKFIQKVKLINFNVKNKLFSISEAKRQICGHVGYMKIANTKNLLEKHLN